MLNEGRIQQADEDIPSHGKPVALVIHAAEMHKDEHKFFQSANGVWLTAFVLVEYIHIAPY